MALNIIEELEVSNCLIVEDTNDQYFFQAVVKYLNLQIEFNSIKISEEDYKSLGGLSAKKLKIVLNELKAEIQKGVIEKVGIILDIDNFLVADRITLVNECLQDVFSSDIQLSHINQLIPIVIDNIEFQFACYFTNIDGSGELETLLRNIKTQDSTYADCLEAWKICLHECNKEISNKDFDKFWISNYIRFDTCLKKEKGQANRKCSISEVGFKYVMENKTHIWDFTHPSLLELKNFLNLFY